MLDYSYSDEQKLLRENIRKWGKEHLPEEKIAEAYKNRGIDSAIAKSWVDEGFGKLGIPAEYGGTPCDHVTMAIAIEELCHIGGNIPMAPNLLIMFDVCEFGTEEQIKYAVDFYYENGYPPYCLAISEPEAGSANIYMTTTAKKLGDGNVEINGTKTWVTFAEHANGFIVVLSLIHISEPTRP